MIILKRPYYLFSLLAVIMAGGIPVASAQVQENIPSISINPQDLKGGSPTFGGGGAPIFNYPNDYLNDTLSLQYQNVLLEKMILRQGTIARTEKSFMDVGVPFNQPAPPRGICEQIPVNVPCYKAYPDLYPGAVPEVTQIEEGELSEEEEIAAREEVIIKPAEEKPQGPDFSAYKWAEIMCAGGRCSAVISDGEIRQTVREGDVIDGSIKVTAISASGVSVSKDGQSAELQSALAPSRGGMASPKYKNVSSGKAQDVKLSGDFNNQAKDLESLFAPTQIKEERQTQTPEKETVVVIPPDDPQAIDDPGPPLGATGLY